MRITGFSAILAAVAGAWLALLVLTVAAGAAEIPAEPPPDWFRGAQYIDSTGCVFVREGEGWQPRLDRAGGPVCGLPPTLSARRTRPDEVAALVPAPQEPRSQRIERALTEAIIPNLHTGELVGDASGMPGAEPEPPVPATLPRAPGDAGLAATVAAVPGLRAGMGAAVQRTGRLCELLGAYADKPRLDAGQALGLCSGTSLALAPEPASVRTGVVRPEARVTVAKAAPPVRLAKVAGTGGAAGPAKASVRNTTRAARGFEAATGMIPADARFVQVGTYADPAEAQGAIRRLGRLGLPVARARQSQGGRPVQIIMAGPFDSRQAVVRTLDRVRKAGFAQARARR